MGLCYYIKDVIVLPEYQGKGIGRMLIAELLKFINDHGIPDTDFLLSYVQCRIRFRFMRNSVSLLMKLSG